MAARSMEMAARSMEVGGKTRRRGSWVSPTPAQASNDGPLLQEARPSRMLRRLPAPLRLLRPTVPSAAAAQDGRVFTSYSIYKGKATLSFDPRPPQFVPLDSGAYKVAKEGCVLLQFAPVVATRQYDWTRKQVFSLSVWEIGTLLTLGPTDSCEFFHDPFKGRREKPGYVACTIAVQTPNGKRLYLNFVFSKQLSQMYVEHILQKREGCMAKNISSPWYKNRMVSLIALSIDLSQS